MWKKINVCSTSMLMVPQFGRSQSAGWQTVNAFKNLLLGTKFYTDEIPCGKVMQRPAVFVVLHQHYTKLQVSNQMACCIGRWINVEPYSMNINIRLSCRCLIKCRVLVGGGFNVEPFASAWNDVTHLQCNEPVIYIKMQRLAAVLYRQPPKRSREI